MKILIIQPYLTKYRADLFNEISNIYEEVHVISSKDKNYGYGLGLRLVDKIVKKMAWHYQNKDIFGAV